MRRFLSRSFVLVVILALTGCNFNTAVVGNNGVCVEAGKWLGKNETRREAISE